MEKIRLNNKLSGRNSNLQAQKRDMLPKNDTAKQKLWECFSVGLLNLFSWKNDRPRIFK